MNQSLRKKSWPLALFGVLALPMDQVDQWKALQFKNIPRHQLNFSDKGLVVDVKGSAAPLIHPLKKEAVIKKIRIQGQLNGLLSFKAPKHQGKKGLDDYALRLGLVVPGKKTLSGPKKWLAASWVKELFKLAPKGKGVDRIEFFVAIQEKSLPEKKSRVHPLSDLLKENFVWSLNKVGEFDLTHQLNTPLKTSAIWLSIDGDDTKSQYQIQIKKIELFE